MPQKHHSPRRTDEGCVRAGLVHAFHTTHTTHTTTWHCRSVLLRQLGDQGFGGHQQPGNARGVLQRAAGHLGRVNDALFHHVAVHIGGGVVAFVGLQLTHPLHDDRAFRTGVRSDVAHGLFQGALHNTHANTLVALEFPFQLIERWDSPQVRHPTTGDNALFDCRTGGIQGVLDAGLLLLHLRFGRGPDVDHSHTTDELRQTLLQFLTVIVRGRLFNLRADLLHTPFNLRRLPSAFDDGGVVLVNRHALGPAEIVQRNVFQFDPQVIGDHVAAGQYGDVTQHLFTPIAKARRLHRRALQCTTQFVDHQRGQGFALNILRDDHQRLAHLGDLLEDGQEVTHVADLFLVQQNVGILQVRFHALGISHKVRRQIATVELHALDDVQRGIHALGLFHRDDTVFANFLHRFGNQVTNGRVIVGRNGTHLGDFLLVLGGAAELFDLFHHHLDSAIDTALEVHRIGTRGDVFHAFAEDRLGQYRRGGCAIPRHIAGLARDLTQHLRAHILEGVLQLDFLRHGDPVFGGDRRAKLFINDDIPPLRTERRLHGFGQLIDTAHDGTTRISAVQNLLSCHTITLLRSRD